MSFVGRRGLTLPGSGEAQWLCKQSDACRERRRFFAMASTAHHCHLLVTVCDWFQQSLQHNSPCRQPPIYGAHAAPSPYDQGGQYVNRNDRQSQRLHVSSPLIQERRVRTESPTSPVPMDQ